MKLMPVFVDFETYWDTDHTLSKMSPTEYVMSPKTEIISMAIKAKDYPTDVFFGETAIRKALNSLDWSEKIAIGHNMSGFDSMIMKWRFGIQPRMWGCTAAMARPKFAKTTGVSLAKLVEHFNIGVKNNTVLMQTKGRRLADFSQEEIDAMRIYNKADTEQCAALFKRLAPITTRKELLLIHMTTEMLVNPKFELDVPLLEAALSVERDAKRKALMELAKMMRVDAEAPRELDWSDEEAVAEFVRSEMASAPRFARLLESCGVDVPMKPSPTNPAKQVPALAKTDEAFLKLQDHPSDLVSMAARTRLSVKSTLLETRINAFLRSGAAAGGFLPMPLKYCGADTTGRWSGEQYNPQNLPRINPSKPKTSDALRNSLKAPKGHSVVVADLSGIELRTNMFLWQVPYAMKLFQDSPDKADLYRYFAAHDLFGILEEEVDKDQRQVGKVAHLGLGFGAGGATFQKVAKLMGGIDMDLEESTDVVNKYRTAHPEIVGGWRRFQDCLPNILQGIETAIDPWELCIVEQGAIRLPSGRRIYYPDLRRERDDKGKTEWWYGQGRHKARIYAGKGVENMVQALARDVIADNAVEFHKRTGLAPSLMVHDELVYVVPDNHAQAMLDELQSIMRTPPAWWPDLVTWSEGDIAKSYGAAK